MEVRVVVDNRVRVEAEGLPREAIAALKAGFEHVNPEYGSKKSMGIPVWNVPRTIRTWEADEGGAVLSFPRGGTGRVLGVLEEFGYDPVVRDAREYGVEQPGPVHRRTLYPYQAEIVRAGLEREQGIFRAPTGSGKTTSLLGLYTALNVPTLVVVHSAALLKQWQERAVAELGLSPKQVGIVQGKRFDLRPLTITIQKSMAAVAESSEEVRRYFGAILADEVHLFAAATFVRTIDPFPARYRFGASADHRRKDRKEFLIYDLFGDVIADVDADALVASGHILEVEVRAVPTAFVAPWYGVPDDPAPRRRSKDPGAVQIDFVRLCKEMADDPERNYLALRMVRDEVEAGAQVLVMAHEREHCLRLGQLFAGAGIPSGYLLGGQESAAEFDATLRRLRSGELRAGVGTYKAIGTGIDLPAVEAAVAVTPIASNEQFFGQVRGRVCRTSAGKRGARLYVLWDREVYPRHLKNLRAWNTNVAVRDEVGEWEPVPRGGGGI